MEYLQILYGYLIQNANGGILKIFFIIIFGLTVQLTAQCTPQRLVALDWFKKKTNKE